MDARSRKKPVGSTESAEDDDARDKNGDPAAAKSRLGAGFDFLLYQKKAGLQQVADEATKEAAAEEEADAGMDDFIPQTPMFSGPKYNTFMLTYFQELDEQVKEEERLMGLSRTPCAPCNAEYDERMRGRMLDMYRSHVHQLELATNFGALYDDPMDLGDFEMMALVAVVAPPHINKNNFLSGLCGSLAFDFSTRPPEESCDREGGGFDFLLYQKKAGLQQIADDATKEAEKKEEEAAVVDTGGGGPRRTVVVNKLPDRFESKWVFLLARDRCSPYARRVGGSDKPVYVDSNTSTNLRAAESVASRRTFRSAARQPSATSTRQAGGFDFLLYQKKAGLQQVADDAAKEAETKDDGGGDDGYEEYGEAEVGEMAEEREEGYFVSGREILRMSPRLINMQPLVMKFGYRFVSEHVLGFMMDTPVLSRFNVISFPDIPEGNEEEHGLRVEGGFDFLLFQKKAGLQQVADDAAAETEKKEETAAVVETGGGGPRRKKVVQAPRPPSSFSTMVARYFCQKADRILVLVDARRDMWRHFVMLMESISCYSGKIAMVYMYPLDQGTGYIMRRYSEQLWNMCKVTRPLAEPVRVYGNSFRDMGLFRSCWFYNDEDMGKDMYYLHKFTGCRIAYELQQRAMLAAILAIIFNHLKDSMPKLRVPFKLPKCLKLNIPGFSDAITIPIFNRTEQARREALYSLDYHFFQLQDKERLPPDMFPCEDFILDTLIYKDFAKLDYVDKKLIENCRRIAEDDMVRVVGRFLEQCPADQLDFDPRSSLCCGKLYDPIVDKMERVQFEAAFDAMRPDVDDKIDTESFVESLISIPMPPGALGRIAVMADHDKDCRLSRDEFIAGMHMALLKMNGLELPMKAPHRYFAGYKRHPFTAIYFRRMTEIGEEVIPGLEMEEEEEEMWDEGGAAAMDAGAKPGEEKKDGAAPAADGGGGGGFFDSIWYQKKAGLQAQAGGQQEDMWASFFTPVAQPAAGKGKGKAPPPEPQTFGAFMAFFKPLKGKKSRDVMVQENYLQEGGVKMTGSFHIFHVL